MARKRCSDDKIKAILIRKRENERKRLERIKADPVQLEKQKEKERLKYLKKRGKGSVKLVDQMSAREHRIKKKQWRENTRKSREMKAARYIVEIASSSFPGESQVNKENENSSTRMCPTKPISSCKLIGRKKIQKNRSKVTRKLKKVEQELLITKRVAERYKKRYHRLKNKDKQSCLTPKSKVKQLLKGSNLVSPAAKKSLLFGQVLAAELEQGIKILPNEKSRQMFSKVISGNLLKKYRVLNSAKSFISKKRVLANKIRKNYSEYERKKGSGCVVSFKIKEDVVKFFEQDTNSRMCPGKKDTRTLKKKKEQKRYLCDTLINLYKKFQEEHPEHKISYTSFTRLRPFWIVDPTIKERDTVLCRLHSNMEMLVEELHKQNVIAEKSCNDLIKNECCEKKRVECLERMCEICGDIEVQFQECDENQQVSYMRWRMLNETYIDKTGLKKFAKKPKKISLLTTVGEMISTFKKEWPAYMHHIANIIHQHKEMTNLKTGLKPNEILIHVDFSQNYACKYSSEIQSVHFVGGQQVTLHTGILYFREPGGTSLQVHPFSTLSESLSHNAAAIWAHLQPVLKDHLQQHPHVDTIYGLSDGPSNQYRNKTMFYIIGTLVHQEFPNVNAITWNYLEAGHGKGAPDGIGGILKRTADKLVIHGKDIPDHKTLIKELNSANTGVKLTEVTIEDVAKIDLQLKDKEILRFKGAIKVHQICWSIEKQNILNFRRLSCFKCGPTVCCKHYNIRHEFPMTSEEPPNTSLLQSPKNNEKDVISPRVIKSGVFLLVDLKSGKHEKTYTYAAVCQSEVCDDGEILVMYLKNFGRDGKMFQMDEKDVSYITFEQIRDVLPQPQLKCNGNRIHYVFPYAIDVFEKA